VFDATEVEHIFLVAHAENQVALADWPRAPLTQ
jgi:hypothetical protein